jgi:hypothetical protein
MPSEHETWRACKRRCLTGRRAHRFGARHVPPAPYQCVAITQQACSTRTTCSMHATCAIYATHAIMHDACTCAHALRCAASDLGHNHEGRGTPESAATFMFPAILAREKKNRRLLRRKTWHAPHAQQGMWHTVA